MPRVKGTIRFLKRAAAGLGAVLVLACIATLDFVDFTPAVRTTYYKQTRGLFEQRAATNTVFTGTLKAGFGVAKLTPSINASGDAPEKGEFRAMPLAGYGDRKGAPATGVQDDLFVKVAAFEVEGRIAVMFGIDALIVPREVADLAAERLRGELRLEREQLYFSATHTHCSLGAWGHGVVGEMFAGPFNKGSHTWFVEVIVRAARLALADLKDAELGFGSFAAAPFIRNRLVGEYGEVDPQFSFLLVKQKPGRTCVLGSFSAHATVLGGSTMQFSADYPGYWQRAMEAEPNSVAVFLAGGVGSHSPVPGGKGFEGAEKMGSALASLAQKQLRLVTLTNRIAFGLLGLPMQLPELNVRVTEGLRLRPWLSSKLLPGTPGNTFIQGLRLGSSIWLSTPCDFSGEMALRIKDTLKARRYNGVVTSFNGDYIGYVIPRKYYHLDGYEPRVMSFYGPNVPDYLDEFLRGIALDLMD